MKDNFSTQAAAYAKFRPNYPPELISQLAALAPQQQSAWDCATGNGQVALALTAYFEQVLATDISEKQLQQARPHPHIRYALEPAEKCSAPDQSFDLIVVAQAIHWFDFERFYTEVRRLLRPGGVLALIGYGLFRTGDAGVDAVVDHFYKNITDPYWDPERRYIDEAYRTIPFPFEEIEMPHFEMKSHWSADDVLGYFNTWSAVQHYIRKNRQNPVDLIEADLRKAWGQEAERQINCPLLVRVGR